MNTVMNARRGFVTCLPAVICFWAGSSATAQIQSATSTPGDYVCVERGPDSKVWQRAVFQTNQSGVVRTNLQSYTELATGLCYLQDGQYVDSVEEVEPVAGGAQAVQGRHQVQWSFNANNPNGAVTLTTPDGKKLTSTVFGMAWYDTASGSNAALARLQDCNGSIVAPNQVVYADAFSNLTADVQYTYRKAGLSQDIVLRQSPPAPDRYGLSDETTVLQVYTEFFDPPLPEMTAVTNGNVVDHQVLDFGDMKIGVGQALFLKGQDAPLPAGMVTKQWIQVNGRTFLIEAIPYPAISNQLQQLPQASNLKLRRGAVRRVVLMESNPSRGGGSAKEGRPMKQARVENTQPRLLVDYDVLSSSTNNLTLQGDTTYLVTGIVSVSGTVTIEGGTVVKYTNNTDTEITAANYVCQTAPYRPGVFTSIFDNSVGTVISTNGTPIAAGAQCLNFNSPTNSLTFTNLRFSYAVFGIWGTIVSGSPNSISIRDCQFINCLYAFFSTALLVPAFPVNVDNVLISQCDSGIVALDVASGYAQFNTVNVTSDHVGTFVSGGSSNVCYATNSLFTATGTSGISSSTDCYTNASSNGVYQTIGAGSYYLAYGSTNRGVGTTNIDPALLADLQTRTTYPPVTNFYGWFTNDYTFFPQAQRDNNGATVDLGYHYDPIDYAVCMVISNATATVLPGTALAMNGPQYGVLLSSNAVFNCNGTATNLIHIVRYNTVQEQSNTNWESTNWNGSVLASDQRGASAASFFFTEWSVLGGDGQFATDGNGVSPVGFHDCQFFGGGVVGNAQTLLSTNCLFQRVNMTLTNAGVNTVISNTFCNNLFLDGELLYDHNTNFDTGTWTFRDNLFDHTSNTVILTSPNDIFSNNAYITNCSSLVSSGSNVILTNSPGYERGALGDYYYPTNLTNLIHQGSRSAPAAGLYHYTVTTNNVIEGTNQVSIGFHYVATHTNGVPLDSNGDGVPDYLEDANGDGLVDDGETNWALAILTQPASQTGCGGSNLTFSVGADGVPPLSYQWQFDGTNMPAATNSSLTLSNLSSAQVGSYCVAVSNAFGLMTSSAATFELVLPPQIISIEPPASPGTNWINATSVWLSVGATNADESDYPLSYQWSVNGTNVSGATNCVFSIDLSSGEYDTGAVTVSNAACSTYLSWGTFVCALPGMVETWGADGSGECERPVNLTNAAAIAAGEYQSVAVTDSGSVVQWGQYSNGLNLYSVTNYSVATPPPASNVVAVAASLGHDIALIGGGSVVTWGLTNDAANTVPTNLSPATAVAAGWHHNLALLTNGAVVGWGSNSNGQTTIPSDLTNANAATAIAAGELFSLALRSNGTVEAWGDNTYGQTNVPPGLSNIVAIAAGGQHCLALTSNGMVVSWGNDDFNQTNVPSGMSNVMAIAAGSAHSLALINDGTYAAWGDNSEGQTNPISQGSGVVVKLIAAGGDHSMVAISSPLVQYPVDVSKDLLLIYNTASTDSSNVCAYYLANRPLVSNANVLGIDCSTNEQVANAEYTGVIAPQIQNWLTTNPTKRPSYVILFQDIPSRPDATYTAPSTQVQINATCATNWHPFVSSINMNGTAGTNDCISYIDKLAFFGSNSPSMLFISASAGGYENTNWYFDDSEVGYSLFGGLGYEAELGVLAADPSASVFYSYLTIITNATNVVGYYSRGVHNNYFTGGYPTNGQIVFSGASDWYLIETDESYNGLRVSSQGNFLGWYASNAFGGSGYSSTPVGAVSHVEEPSQAENNPYLYFGLWAEGKSFACCAWNSFYGYGTPYLQVVGDPFVTR